MLGNGDARGKHQLPFHLTHPFEKRTIAGLDARLADVDGDQKAEGKKGSPRKHNDSLNLFVGSLTCGAWCGRMLGDDDAGGKHLLPFHLTHPFEKRTITVPV